MRNRVALLIDNVDNVMKSATLCTILTQPEWSDRMLGSNKKAIVQTNTLILSSGNNMGIAKDLVRRALICTLDAGMEKPEERTFAGKPLLDTVLEQRPQLVAAALTIILAYLHAGSPDQNVVSYGNFEQWQEWCRFPLTWLGRKDPYATKAKLEARDTTRAETDALINAWYDVFGDQSQTVADAVNFVQGFIEQHHRDNDRKKENEERDPLPEKYAAFHAATDKWRKGRDVNLRSLGQYISSISGVVRNKLRFELDGVKHHASKWKIAEIKPT